MRNFSRIIITLALFFIVAHPVQAADNLTRGERAFVVKTALFLLKYIDLNEVNEIDHPKKRDSADTGIFKLLSDFHQPLQGHFENNIAVIHERMYVSIADRISDGNHTITPFADELLRYLFSNFHLERIFVELLRPANTSEKNSQNRHIAKALLYLAGYNVLIDENFSAIDINYLKEYMKNLLEFPDTVRNATGNRDPSLMLDGIKNHLYYASAEIIDDIRICELDSECGIYDRNRLYLMNKNEYVALINGYREDRAELAALLLTLEPDVPSAYGRGLFTYPWQNAQDDVRRQILKLAPIAGKYPLDRDTTKIDVSALPWYDNVRIVRVKNSQWEQGNLFIYYLIDKAGGLYWLNGSSPPLHEINARAPIRIIRRNVLDYIWFFTFFVRGSDGPFLIAESPEDTFVPRQIDSETRQTFIENLKPSSIKIRNLDGTYEVKATIYYGNAIFEASLVLKPDGMVEMRDDYLLASDLPVKIDAPIN